MACSTSSRETMPSSAWRLIRVPTPLSHLSDSSTLNLSFVRAARMSDFAVLTPLALLDRVSWSIELSIICGTPPISLYSSRESGRTLVMI